METKSWASESVCGRSNCGPEANGPPPKIKGCTLVGGAESSGTGLASMSSSF